MPRDLFQESGPRDLLTDGADPFQALKTPRAYPKEKGINGPALEDTIKDLPKLGLQGVFQLQQGFMDLPVGGAQLISKFLPQGAEDAVANYMREREKQYAKYTGANEYPGIQPGRVAGNVMSGLALSPNKIPASLFGRVVEGAKTGAKVGLLTPVDPDAQDFAARKVVQTGVSAAAGAIAPPVVEGLTRAAASVVNALGGKISGAASTISGQTRPAAIEARLEIELQRNGVDWSKLPREMRDQLLGEIDKALKSGGKLDPQAIQRVGDFARLGIQPTRGQVTRDPYEFANERNLGKMEIGAPIAQRLNEQNTQMIGTLDAARRRASQSPDLYEAGQGAIRSLKSSGQAQKSVVDQAYQAARGQAGIEADVPLEPVAQKIGQLIEDFGDDKIPSAVMKRLNEFGVMGGKQSRVFNIREAEKLKTLIDNNIDGPGTPTAKALGELKRSVDDAINSLGDQPGSEAAAAFKAARSAASQRFETLKQTPALAAVMDKSKQLTPEAFIEQHFVRGSVDNVKSAMGQIPVEGRSEVQAGVLDWIRKQAVLGDGDTATLSAAGIKRALDTIGDRKLAEIFKGNANLLADLQALKRVSAYIDRAPKSSGVNYSSSATTLMDALDKVGRLPVLGAVVGRPGDLLRASQVARALQGGAPVQPASPVISPQLVERLVPRIGLLGGVTASGVAPLSLLGSPLIENNVRSKNERRY